MIFHVLLIFVSLYNGSIVFVLLDQTCQMMHMVLYGRYDKRYAIDCSKLNKLGWQTRTKLYDSIKDTALWVVE